MAMTMADSVIRKACDRCHTQKLSCKRVGEEPCERCTRLRTECKSSPSLRYKKQQHQQQPPRQQHFPQQFQQHSQPHQHQHHILSQQQQAGPPQAPSAETVQIRSRSPKRRRTDSDSSLVLPEAVPIASSAEVLTAKTHPSVTPETVLDISDFNFNFDQLGFFAPTQPEHLSHPGIPARAEDFHPHQGLFVEPWDHHQLALPSSGYNTVTPNPLPLADINPSPRILPSGPVRRSGAVEHGTEKRARRRSGHRPRQISLRQNTLRPQHLDPEVAPVHWMAQLNDINTRLLDLSSALPGQQETAQNGPPLGRPADERFKASGFPIDEMFQLTRRVADILENFSAPGLRKDAGKSRAPLDGSDPANSMLVLSTYVRLLDMYQRVFNLVSMELAQADKEAAFHFWKLPDVSVGSFAVESSPSLQMSLTIQLAEEFLGRLRSTTAALNSSLRNGGGDGKATGANRASMFAGVVDVSYQAVKSREESLGKHLSELRAEIEVFLEA